MSALRGPDIPKLDTAKLATTGLIRGKLFGNNEFLGRHIDIVASDRDQFIDIRKSIYKNCYSSKTVHFVHHMMLAFLALNLEWDELNED